MARRAPADQRERRPGRDACAFAWAQLLRYQPKRERIFSWLLTVATREAWRLARREATEASAEVLGADAAGEDGGGYALVEDPAASLERRLEAREGLRRVAELPDRQRHILVRQLAGLSYDEIGAETGDSWRTVELSCAARTPASAARGAKSTARP